MPLNVVFWDRICLGAELAIGPTGTLAWGGWYGECESTVKKDSNRIEEKCMKLNKSLFAAFSGVALMGLLTGCSSVMCGPRQSVSINSRPAGAEVLVYNSECKVVFKKATPCVAELQRSTPDGQPGNYIVLVRKKGFAPVQVPLTGRVNDAYYANIMFGGIGMLVDSATGAKWTLTPDSVDAESVTPNAGIFNQDDVLVSLKPRATAAPDTLAEYVGPGRE